MQNYFVDVSAGSKLHFNTAFWMVVVFCSVNTNVTKSGPTSSVFECSGSGTL